MIDVLYLAYLNENLDYKIKVVEKFLSSYKNQPAGIEHNLVIIAKNWDDAELYEQLLTLAKEYNAKVIDLPDDGFDLGAYIRISNILESEYIYCLGSSIEIEADNWLLHSFNAFQETAKVQLVGPMGSWENGVTDIFPNYHIRTCCFMIKRKLFLEYAATQNFPQKKEDTWLMEHGIKSLTKFVFNKGFQVVVVNSDGKSFSPKNWVLSDTYYYPAKIFKNLMSDKQARLYFTSEPDQKACLEYLAWGKNFTKYPNNLIQEYSKKINIFLPYNNVIYVYSSNVFHQIFVGDVCNKITTKAFIDKTEKNIAKKYKYYGELTGYYWLLKNFFCSLDSEYVGFCQFYNFLDFNSEKPISPKTTNMYVDDFQKAFATYTEDEVYKCVHNYNAIVAEKKIVGETVYNHYLKSYSEKYLNLTIDSIKTVFPEYRQAVNKFMESDFIYPFGTFIMKKEMIIEFLNWLFDVLANIERKTNLNTLKTLDDIQSVFISECFLNVWLLHQQKTNNFKIRALNKIETFYDIHKYLAKCLQDMNIPSNLINLGK